MEANDPLQSLVSTDTNKVNREKLAQILEEYVSFEPPSGVINFKSSFARLDNIKKVEIILAAVKARSLLFEQEDRILPSKIIELDALPEGSVKSSLKKLYDDRKIKKDEQGYFLPNYRIDDILSQLSDK